MPPTNLDGIGEMASKELLEYRKERDKKSRFRRMACEIGEELDVCDLCYEPMSISRSTTFSMYRFMEKVVERVPWSAPATERPVLERQTV